ncbi:unnamed protein product [Scytosiphon promiscuus]
MPGYDERASILRGAGDTILNIVCDLATPEQWAEWLRIPLEHAARTANYEVVNKLLQAGADGSAGWKGCNGQTLLHAAADGGNEQVVSALIRAGARMDVHSRADVLKRTPLHLAVGDGRVAAAKVLMMAGADVNRLDAKNYGPLHLAIMQGHAGLADDLLLKGADPSLTCRDGVCPIHLAAGSGQDSIVRSLLHKGVDVNARTIEGMTALFMAVVEERISTVKLLLTWGAGWATPDTTTTPLHWASRKDAREILEALLDAGADVEEKNAKGHSPLYVTVWYRSHETMLALLKRRANVNAKTKRNTTPLHAACLANDPHTADILLRWGADETAVDSLGRTPTSRMPSKIDKTELADLEYLSELLEFAPQDRAWRRRGFFVLCRSHQDRLRLPVEIPDTAESSGQPLQRPNRRSKRGQVKVEVTMGGAESGGGGSSASPGRSDVARERSPAGSSGGFDGVAAWLMGLTDENIFRRVIGYL